MKKVVATITVLVVIVSELLVPIYTVRAGLFDDAATWGVWAKEYILDPLSSILSRQLIRMLGNDIINYIQGGGKPRFIQKPGRFLQEAVDIAGGQFIADNVGFACQPFQASLNILLNRTSFPSQEFPERLTCSASEIWADFQNFKRDFRDGGGWDTWIRLHETRNTLLGAALLADDELVRRLSIEKEAAKVEAQIGQGFLNQKTCSKILVDYGPGGTEVVSIDETLTTSAEWDALVKRYKGLTKPVPGLPAGYAARSVSCVPGAERIVTPGKLIGDQVSSAVGSDIASLIAADELGEVLGAVIDALINRGVREGLALMPTGRGSQTRPSQGTYSTRGQQPQTQPGLEGAAAAELLNNLIEARNGAEQVIALKKKLIAREGQNARFNQNLTNRFPEILDLALDTGKNLENLGKCEEARLNDTGGIVDHCLFAGFNSETSNPGPYHANRIFYTTLASDWQKVVELLSNLVSRTGAIVARATTNAQCRAVADNIEIPKLTITLSPQEDDPTIPKALPFTSTDGTTLNWNTEKGWLYELEGKEPGKEVEKEKISDLRLYLEFSALPLAEAERDLAQNNPFATLIEGVNEQIKVLEADREALDALIQQTSTYASVLADYDRAARTEGLTAAIGRYNDALTSGDDAVIETEYRALLDVKSRTRARWLQEQQTIAANASESDFARGRAQEKIPIIEQAIRIIENSLQSEEDTYDPTQVGLSTSQAVAQVLEMNLSALEGEVQLRNFRIQQEKQKAVDELGEFKERDLDRYRAALTRDSSAWGQYFQLRFKKTYAGIIDVFYHDYVSGKLSSIESQCGL